ncbi:MAG: polymorphic toxin-type HINT domain-containing protein [Paludisphaera borealis]|uniref:polymorphic toxin-type HINT domain-containing protein n=1 Tax=Paludisphaera borealis TaxID=1387353 RepID=UPI00284AF6DD|nr:polymorphic toxin-type HINT domain-containing protein [Paludisphaera borealis]MDR3622745.1 polymorphic toxin-type HINT domain-containing protein [Paludisphaera borealis]
MVSALLVSWALGVAAALEPEAAKPPGPDLVAYEAAKAGAGRDADAHVALALWCEAHGMPAEKATHLARAVLIDPSHAKARGLLGYVKHEGKWLRPEEVSRAVEESPESQALFREYLGRRTQSRDKADDQYRLAQWCDEHGLKQQATAHYHRVLELDPGRDSAWKHLGFKKVSGQWVKPELLAAQKAERDAQAKADKFWKPKLEKLKDALSGRDKAKKAEAEKSIAAIVDPRAVPMVWAVFARGSERSQRVAVKVLGRIEGHGATTALAMIAVFNPIPDVRSEAAQSLMSRDPRDYARLLANLLRDETKYQKKNVAGPGSQGELLVEGKDANVKRLYTPLQLPGVMPGDHVGTDENGRLIAGRYHRYFGERVPTSWLSKSVPYIGSEPDSGLPSGGIFFPAQMLTTPGGQPQASLLPAAFQKAGLSPQQSNELVARLTPSPGIAINANRPFQGMNGTLILQDSIEMPLAWAAAEAQASAHVAQHQLTRDVQAIESHNAQVREMNDRVKKILRNASGRDLGDDRDKWMEWVYDVEGYGFPLKVAASKPPTIVESVPLDYQPQTLPVAQTSIVALYNVGPSCFAGGTPVRTLQGARPIEEVRVGDQVLSQNTTTGKLEYQPVVTVFHNPPNVTYRIDLGSESVFPTGIHRFWKAGHGWIMARDVKAGDRLRTIGGTVEVVAASKDRVQPVFNLLLAGGDNYCVGGQGVLAHDNGFVNPVERPFDGVPALADLRATRKP